MAEIEQPNFNSFVEYDFLCNAVGLGKHIQELYDRSRSFAQENQWQNHIAVAAVMIPCLHYLGLRSWLSRILGRMAWSYIRLGEESHARRALIISEAYDAWQAAANYYWSSEYSYRANKEKLWREFLDDFRRVCANRLGFDISGSPTDLELAVAFYEKLIEVEATQVGFRDANNQSDIGRYHELKARLTSEPVDFKTASEHYEEAGLHSYAAFCRAFFYICQAVKQKSSNLKKCDLYTRALGEATQGPIFVDQDIKEILIKYLEVQIACCDLINSLEALPHNLGNTREIERGYKKIHSLVVGLPDDANTHLTSLGARFLSLSRTNAWRKLIAFFNDIDTTVCPMEIEVAQDLANRLDDVQAFLPSLTFLATREET
jgi:hypothetical protein